MHVCDSPVSTCFASQTKETHFHNPSTKLDLRLRNSSRASPHVHAPLEHKKAMSKLMMSSAPKTLAHTRTNAATTITSK